MRNDLVIWVDLETTGTDENHDVILEVGAILTEGPPTYRIIETIQFVTDELTPHRLWAMPNEVLEMHLRNGLLDAAKGKYGERVSIEEADSILDEVMRAHAGTEHVPLAGSGVSHFDRRFIKRYLPKFDKHLSYWAHDVGVLRRALRAVGFAIPESGNLKHRALDDALDHRDEMVTYMLALEELRQARLSHPDSDCAQGGYCPAHQIIVNEPPGGSETIGVVEAPQEDQAA